MRSILVGLAVCAMPLMANGDTAAENLTAAAETAVVTMPIWQPQGGETIAFEVLRKGKPFGTHSVAFEALDDGTLRVSNDIDLQVKFGPITAYKYRHESTETWRDGSLIELVGETRKEGEDLEVTASLLADGLGVEGTNYSGIVGAGVIPSSHWNSAQVFQDAILSSEGGQMLDITVDNLGEELLAIAGENIPATRFRLYSDITFDLWYDAEGRWVKCAFEARGQNIVYVLQELY
ncbi:MAG: DUF6134 family protein [Pseudomonadota bacterium]